MNADTILKLLHNAGYLNPEIDAEFIYIQDPSCIWQSFQDFIDFAWGLIALLTAILLFGWAISMIRGSKYSSIMVNMRNLILILGTLSVVYPILNVIYGKDFIAAQCKEVKVKRQHVQELLNLRDKDVAAQSDNENYEVFTIYDSGASSIIEGYDADSELSEDIENLLKNSAAAISASGTQVPNAKPDTKMVPISAGPLSAGGATEKYASNNSTSSDMTASFYSSVGGLNTAYVNVNNLPISATDGKGNDVVYTYPSGKRVVRSGGSRAWRNFNPGNLRYTEFTKKVGAIGKAGEFAVFPSEEVGMYAVRALLRTNKYAQKTIKGAIAIYAPSFENDTTRYQNVIVKRTGLSLDRVMSTLTDAELDSLIYAIRSHEGWDANKETRRIHS